MLVTSRLDRAFRVVEATKRQTRRKAGTQSHGTRTVSRAAEGGNTHVYDEDAAGGRLGPGRAVQRRDRVHRRNRPAGHSDPGLRIDDEVDLVLHGDLTQVPTPTVKLGFNGALETDMYTCVAGTFASSATPFVCTIDDGPKLTKNVTSTQVLVVSANA